MRLDGKVHGRLFKNKNLEEIPEDEFVVFRPHDNAFVPALECYLQYCINLGVSATQIAAIEDLQRRVENWRSRNPDRCKLPDVEPGEIQT